MIRVVMRRTTFGGLWGRFLGVLEKKGALVDNINFTKNVNSKDLNPELAWDEVDRQFQVTWCVVCLVF
jgi:hypothetical protein